MNGWAVLTLLRIRHDGQAMANPMMGVWRMRCLAGAGRRLRVKSGRCCPVRPCQNVLDRIPLTRAGVIPVGIRRVSSDSGSFPSWVRLKRAFGRSRRGNGFALTAKRCQ
jgi:hypothetical protein